MSKYVTIKHKDLGEAEVMPSALEVWKERGWEEVTESRRAKGTRSPRNAPKAAGGEAPASKTG